MADDISKKISIDVEINQTGQQQLDQYKNAFLDLKNSINATAAPLNNLSKTLSSLDKDVTELGKSIGKLSSQNKEMSGSGEEVTKTVEKLTSTWKTWKEAIALFTEEFGLLEASLTGGLTILALYGPSILKWIGDLVKGTTTLSALNKILKDNKIIMDAVNKARAEGINNAQAELTHVKLLYDVATDHNLALRDRLIAANKLKDQYPDIFKNISDEIIITGKATIAYQKLNKAISGVSQATEFEAHISRNRQQKNRNDDDIRNAITKQKELQKEVKKLRDELTKTFGDSPINNRNSDAIGFARDQSTTVSAQIKSLENKIEESKILASHLDSDNKLLAGQNEMFRKSIKAVIKESGAETLFGPVQTKSTPKTINDYSSKKAQKDFFIEAEHIQKESLTRQLQTTYSAYGAEAKAADDHYNEDLTKLKELLDNKQITQAEFDKVSQQLQNEHHIALAAIAEKYNEQDAKNVQQAANELSELKIKGMQAGADKEIAQLKQQQEEREQFFTQEAAENKQLIDKLNAEKAAALKDDPNEDVSALEKQLATRQQIIKINDEKRIEEEKQTADAIKKIRDTETQNALVKADQKDIQKATDPEKKLAAEKKLVTDKYQFEIEQAKANSAKVAELTSAQNDELNALDDKFQKDKTEAAKKAAQERKDFELQTAKQLSAAAFSFITNGIKSQTDSKIKQLEADKTAELKNTSLTAAQKQAIQDSYQKKEAAVKAKAFKEEQLASIAQAVINGALAITKASAQTGVLSAFAIPAIIAETAIQVATISAQKPPAYARGGMHYQSDGRGGVLPGYSHTDDTNAYLRSGEGIVVSEAMRQPWARNLVSAINVGFGGRDFSVANPGRGYAIGGVFTDGGNANRYYNQPVTDQKNLANSIAYQMINNFPPVYVDVKDINNQQNILAQTINRVNL